MDAPYPPLSVPATPDQFLAHLGLPGVTPDLPAADLADWWNDLAWDRRAAMRDCLTAAYPDHVTAAAFDAEFPTLRGRTVGDVCRFLADRVPRPVVRPWRGDRVAGAFLHVRHLLAAAGADVAGVRPSAPLGSYLRAHPDAFGRPLHQLAPGLPWVGRHRPVERAGLAGLFAGLGLALLLLGAGELTSDPRPGEVAAGLLCLGLPLAAAVALVGSRLPPRRVTLGDLVTFRDLAAAVAVQSPP